MKETSSQLLRNKNTVISWWFICGSATPNTKPDNVKSISLIQSCLLWWLIPFP